MDFNTFYKNFRKAPEYDLLIETKCNINQLKQMTSRELVAIFYANELWEHKLKAKQIVKFFDKRFHKLILDSLIPRMKPEGIAVAWLSIKDYYKKAEEWNSKHPIVQNLYPHRKI
jgi:hypothetical protein